MNKIYIDCGFYAGVALKLLVEAGRIDKTWTVYAFEPSPIIIEAGYHDNLPIPVNFIQKAVWIENGEVPFWESKRQNANHIADTSSDSEEKKVMVPSIDFSDFMRNLPDAYIICSMDIEGAEFAVLEKMIKECTIDKIDELDVEFHHRLMADYDDTHARKIIKQLNKHGVTVRLKERLV